jgi:hypothetical protein
MHSGCGCKAPTTGSCLLCARARMLHMCVCVIACTSVCKASASLQARQHFVVVVRHVSWIAWELGAVEKTSRSWAVVMQTERGAPGLRFFANPHSKNLRFWLRGGWVGGLLGFSRRWQVAGWVGAYLGVFRRTTSLARAFDGVRT